MKGYIFLLVVFTGSMSFADYNERPMTSTERRRRDSVRSLQESFIDMVYGLSFDRKTPVHPFALPLTQNQLLYFIAETHLDYGTKNFLKRVNTMYADIEERLNLILSDDVKINFTNLLIDHALPALDFGDSRCTLFLDDSSLKTK